MMRLLRSVTIGMILTALWLAAAVGTSVDFKHEGPNSPLFRPLDSWARLIGLTGIPQAMDRLNPSLGIIFAFAIFLLPPVVFFACVADLAVWARQKWLIERR